MTIRITEIGLLTNPDHDGISTLCGEEMFSYLDRRNLKYEYVDIDNENYVVLEGIEIFYTYAESKYKQSVHDSNCNCNRNFYICNEEKMKKEFEEYKQKEELFNLWKVGKTRTYDPITKKWSRY